jgi:uncharacterized protein with von Willebrand factor type A (vWA) domain
MKLNKHTEFLRITTSEPLTIACSALADFLWEDFVVERKPSVKYLIDYYNIKNLSRFGKELFERLYKADDVNWLVTEEAYENFFRAQQNGEDVKFPEGYKPENGVWYAIMSDISLAAAWPHLLNRSVGNQFNAGNNAINILNYLAEVIEDLIEKNLLDVQLVFNSKDKLEELRKQFNKAYTKGNKVEMDKVRTEGKGLSKEIHDAIQNLKNQIGAHTSRIIDNSNKDCDELSNSISTFFGSEKGQGYHKTDLQTKKDLAEKLKRNPKLKELSKKLGALRRVWHERKRAKIIKSPYESINGAIFSNDIIRTFPVDLALAGTDQGRLLFALKYSQKTLLTKDYVSHRKDIGKGPIILYVDTSGSMSGEPEVWSKAISFVISEEALKENREVQIHLFDTRVESSITLKGNRKTNKDLLDFAGTWYLGGGTNFNAVITHALGQAKTSDRSDILMITDGHSEVQDSKIKALQSFKQRTGTMWSTVCIGAQVPSVVHAFSDEAYAVDISAQAETIDVIQKCIR